MILPAFMPAILSVLLALPGPPCGGCGSGPDPAGGRGTSTSVHCHWLEVTDVAPGSPAEAAGILVGDAILSCAGQSVGCLGDLNRKMATASGDTVELTVERNGLAVTVLLPAGESGIRLREWQQDIEPDSDAVTVPGVPRLDATDGKLNSFMAALEAVVRGRGGLADYVFLCGVSGAAFRTRFLDGRLVDPFESPSGFEDATTALAACGLAGKLRRVSTDGKNWPAVRAEVRTSIVAGFPVLGAGLGGGPDWSVITGYQQDGEELLGRTGNATRKGYDILGGLPSAVVILGEASPPPELRAGYYRSFVTVAAGLTVEGQRDGEAGLTAFERWIQELTSDDSAAPDSARLGEVVDGHYRRLRRLIHDRKVGIEYLRRAAQELPQLKPKLDTLVRLYEEEAGQLAALVADLPDPGGSPPAGDWTPAVRARHAAALEAARLLEARAVPVWRLLAAVE